MTYEDYVIRRDPGRRLTHVYMPTALALKRATGAAVGDARQEAARLMRCLRMAEQIGLAWRPYGVIVAHYRREAPRA